MAESVVVHGATGTQGRPVVAAMLAAGYALRAISRSGWQGALPPGVTSHSPDLTDADALAAAYDGAATVIPVLPGGVADDEAERQSEAILEALTKAAVPRAIFNSSGALWDIPTGLPMLDARRHLANGLAEVVDQSAIIGPMGMYFEVFAADWVIERVKTNGALVGPIPAQAPFRPVAMADLASEMFEALKGPSELWGTRSFVTGPEDVTGADFANTISAHSGRSVVYEHLTPQDHMASVADGLSPQYAKNLASLYGSGAQIPPPSEPGPRSRIIEGKTGLSAFVASQNWI